MIAALESERYVLAAALYFGREAVVAAGDLAPDDFGHPLHGRAWDAIRVLDGKNAPIDAVSVAEQLRPCADLFRAVAPAHEDAADPVPALAAWLVSDIGAGAGVPGGVPHHAAIVRDRRTLQRLAELGEEVKRAALTEGADAAETLACAEGALLALSARAGGVRMTALRDALRAAVKRIEARHEARQRMTGVPSGIGELDAITAGWQPGHLVIVASRPGMGKTSLAMNLAIAAGCPVLVFSLEMSEDELAERSLASAGGVDSWAIRTGRLEPRQWLWLTKGAAIVSEAPVTICDRGGMRLGELRSAARRWRLRNADKPALVLVDYLQLVSGDGKRRDGNREQEVAEVSRGLKSLAKELGATVIALAQLNRAVEQRADKRPLLSDLRESGGIEADADLVGFIYRDDEYNPRSPVPGTAELILRKNRHGAVATIPTWFDKASTRFREMSEDEARRYVQSITPRGKE